MSYLEEIEQIKLEHYFLLIERRRAEISLKEVKENEEKIRQLNQLLYKKTGRFITDD